MIVFTLSDIFKWVDDIENASLPHLDLARNHNEWQEQTETYIYPADVGLRMKIFCEMYLFVYEPHLVLYSTANHLRLSRSHFRRRFIRDACLIPTIHIYESCLLGRILWTFRRWPCLYVLFRFLGDWHLYRLTLLWNIFEYSLHKDTK